METKMTLLAKSELQRLSFPDFTVEKMRFDIQNKKLVVEMNGGHLDINGGMTLHSCKMLFKDWEDIEVKLYRARTKKWEILNADHIESLVDICEFEYGQNIILRGFGSQTGQWIEIVLAKPSVEIGYLKKT